MDVTKSILEEVRSFMGLESTNEEFDTELISHINASISTLNQNGVGKTCVVKDSSSLWSDLIDSTQTTGNSFQDLIPLYICLNAKILFDPPPPSSVSYYSQRISELLWRLKIAYEDPYVPLEPTTDDE